MRSLPIFGGIIIACVFAFLPASTFSGDALCQGITGFQDACDSQNVVTEKVLPETAALLLRIVAGLSVLFIVWGGILMLISMGEESKTAQAKWAIIYSLVGLFGAILSQAFVGTVAQTPLTIAAGEKGEVIVIKAAVAFLVKAVNVVFLSVIIFAGIRMLLGQGQPEEFGRAKKMIAWTIAGAVIVNVARTLVRAILTLFPGL